MQGVGFRAFICQLAEDIGLNGEVWNRHDGSVEAIIASDDQQVQAFAFRLPLAPGKVEGTSILAADDEAEIEQGFRITKTR